MGRHDPVPGNGGAGGDNGGDSGGGIGGSEVFTRHSGDAARSAKDLGPDFDYRLDSIGVIGFTTITAASSVLGEYPDGAGLYIMDELTTPDGTARIIRASKDGVSFEKQKVDGVFQEWIPQVAATPQEPTEVVEEGWPSAAPLAFTQALEKHIVAGCAGQSNWEGFSGPYTHQPYGRDAQHPRFSEYSRGIPRVRYIPAEPGRKMPYREPAQDVVSQQTSPKGSFGRRFCELNEGVELTIGTYAVGGTGFADARWNAPTPDPVTGGANRPIGDLLDTFVTGMNAALALNPEDRFRIFCWHQGENEASAGYTAAQYLQELKDMVAYVRANITGAEDSVFICGTFTPELTALNPGPSGNGTGTYAEVQSVIRNIAAEIPRSDFVEMSGQSAQEIDIRHFDPQSYDYMGRKYAETATRLLALQESTTALAHRLVYDAEHGEMRDLEGTNARVYAGVYVDDDVYGKVLRCDNQGFDTGLSIGPRWTKALRVKFKRLPDIEMSLISGRREAAGQATGHIWSIRVISNDLNAGVSAGGLVNADPTPAGQRLVENVWYHLTCTFNGSEFRVYRDGNLLGSMPVTGGAVDMELDQIVQIGTWGTGASTADFVCTDVRLLPFVATPAQVTAISKAPVPGAVNSIHQQDQFRTATLLGVDPAPENDWRALHASRWYYVLYSAGQATARGLPWDSTVFTGATRSVWHIELRTVLPGASNGYFFAYSVGISPAGSQVTRSWVAFATRAPGVRDWTVQEWKELGQFVPSDDGQGGMNLVRQLSVDSSGVPSYVLVP